MRSLLEVEAAAQESSSSASDSASTETICKLMSWKRGHQRAMWTVKHIEGTKLRMKKRRKPSYRPEDLEAFYRLLGVYSELWSAQGSSTLNSGGQWLRVTLKPPPPLGSYLLSMVVEYFGRVQLPGHLYNRIHFFLALYIASDMEEDSPTSKRSIFQFLLGKEHWPELYKEFQKLKMEFFHAMEYQARVTQELCEEIQAQKPHHWVWRRKRQCTP
ncbi:putative speedy protein-like protein 3 [Desmodus rotundus]|uniref:putative speedy protein-like protein 3 n=1 Tax=Desmodus rotundus TaxID=9430 RepID=UPI0023818314|nr:putative speedy protein E21 [Desmodus rotundus]